MVEKIVIIINDNIIILGNAEDIDMIFKEAELLKSLNHNNIVKFINCYTLENMKVVFIMEYLEGGELLEYIKEKEKLSEIEARYFFKQILQAIKYCHNQKLIHRDLKLENILLSDKKSLEIKAKSFKKNI